MEVEIHLVLCTTLFHNYSYKRPFLVFHNYSYIFLLMLIGIPKLTSLSQKIQRMSLSAFLAPYIRTIPYVIFFLPRHFFYASPRSRQPPAK